MPAGSTRRPCDPAPVAPPGTWAVPGPPPGGAPFDAGRGAPPFRQEEFRGASGAESSAIVAVRGPDLDVHSEQARYFVITSNTKENVVKSIYHSLWATQRKNEQKLDDAFRTASVTILVFSVNGSEAFQGYARMRSPIGRPRSRGIDPFNGFGRLFDVEWLRMYDLPYRDVENLRNPLNGDRSVRYSRDGQELSNMVGQRLCRLVDKHIDDPDSFPDAQPHPPPGSFQAPSGGVWPGAPRPKRSSSVSSGDERRRRRKKMRHAPHPLTSGFDEHIVFFKTLDYDEYLDWFKRYGSTRPGPTPPPNMVGGGQAPPFVGWPPHMMPPPPWGPPPQVAPGPLGLLPGPLPPGAGPTPMLMPP